MKSGKGDLTTPFLSRYHGLKGMDLDIDAFAKKRGIRRTGNFESSPEQRLRIPFGDLSALKGIGNMMDLSGKELSLAIG